MNQSDRTTIIALARDKVTKSAFIFNSSAGLHEPSNKYKYLLDFFEIELRDLNGLVTLNGEYDFGGFSYKIYEELPYPNYYNKDQKIINPIKKKYIDNYNDNEQYPLYNLILNEKAKAKFSEQHNGNIVKLYNELHYKRLQQFYDRLDDLMQYDVVKFYVSRNRISGDVSIQELSRRYFNGDKDAGIELLIRKKRGPLLKKIADDNPDVINSWKEDFEKLIKSYKVGIDVIPQSVADFDTILLLSSLSCEYWEDSWDLLTLICQKAKEKIITYVVNRDNKFEADALSNEYRYLREKYVQELMHEYLCLYDNEVTKKRIYLYAMYEKLTGNN